MNRILLATFLAAVALGLWNWLNRPGDAHPALAILGILCIAGCAFASIGVLFRKGRMAAFVGVLLTLIVGGWLLTNMPISW